MEEARRALKTVRSVCEKLPEACRASALSHADAALAHLEAAAHWVNTAHEAAEPVSLDVLAAHDETTGD